MTVRSTVAGTTLVAMLMSAAGAQDTAAPTAHPPLVISDETIGVLRQHQVGSIILPQGTAPFPAVIVLHGCNGVTQNTFAWARRRRA